MPAEAGWDSERGSLSKSVPIRTNSLVLTERSTMAKAYPLIDTYRRPVVMKSEVEYSTAWWYFLLLFLIGLIALPVVAVVAALSFRLFRYIAVV